MVDEEEPRKPPPTKAKAGQDETPFKLHDANPFQNDEGEGEAHAAFEHLKQYKIETKGDLYAALLEHTKDLYEGTSRQLNDIAQQYFYHMLEHAGETTAQAEEQQTPEPKSDADTPSE